MALSPTSFRSASERSGHGSLHSYRSRSPSPADRKRRRTSLSWATTARSPRSESASDTRPPCWYWHTGKCEPLSGQCPFSHESYRDCFARLVDRSVPSRPPWEDARSYEATSLFLPRLYRRILPSSSSAPREQWVAVLPVPLCQQPQPPFLHRLFVPSLADCSGLSVGDIFVLIAYPQNKSQVQMHQRWGALVLRGSQTAVQAGREAVTHLLESGYVNDGAAERHLSALLRHMQHWRDEHDDRPSSARRPLHFSQDRAASPPPAVRSDPLSPPPSSVMSPLLLRDFYSVDYSQMFSRYLDSTPRQLSSIPQHSANFAPVLCLARPASSSPLSMYVRDPLYVLGFPVPHSLRPMLLGVQGRTKAAISDLSKSDTVNLLIGENPETLPGGVLQAGQWSYLKAIGMREQCDAIMECVFFLVETRRLRSDRNREAVLEQHMAEWHFTKRRVETERALDFFSLYSRQLRSPVFPPHPPMAVPRPERLRTKCMTSFSVRGCPREDTCRFSHLDYATHFVVQCSTIPEPVGAVVRLSTSFRPVLAELPSARPDSPPRYVVSIPLPRLAWLLTCFARSSTFRAAFHPLEAELDSLDSIDSCGGHPSWYCLSAEVSSQHAVDALLETTLWMVEEGHGSIDAPGVNAHDHVRREMKLKKHLDDWERRKARSVSTGDLFALELRGLSLRRCALRPASPVAADAHRSEAGRSSSTPRPPFTMRRPVQQAAPTSPAAHAEYDCSFWSGLFNEMRQRGLRLALQTENEVADFSSSDAAFICALPHAVFACLPIPATVEVREAFVDAGLQGAMDILSIEKRFGVELYTPRLFDDHGNPRNPDRLNWLNVLVTAVNPDGRDMPADALDGALQHIITRCRRAVPGAVPC